MHANLGYGIPWNDSQLDLYSQQLQILGEHYLRHPEMPRVSLLDLKIDVVLNEKHPVRKYCGTGTHMHVYDVDGTLYPCHLFTPLVISPCEIRVGGASLISATLSVCWIRNAGDAAEGHCVPTCYGFNYKASGDPAMRDPVLCRMFKVQLLENCRFHAATLRGKKGGFSREDCKKAKAVLKIHRELDCVTSRVAAFLACVRKKGEWCMTEVLNRLDVELLEEAVVEFEQQNGEVLDDGETPEAFDCGGDCFGVCTSVVRANG